MGNLVVDGLINGSVKPIDDPHRHVRSLQYVASVIDPLAIGAHIEPTRYDAFDALSYVGLIGAGDITYRQELAVDLREAARHIQRGSAVTLDPTRLIGAVDELLTNYGRTQTSEVSVR